MSESQKTYRQFKDPWQLRFHLPPGLDREATPGEIFRQYTNAQHVVGLPRQFRPAVGSTILYEDCRWRITGVEAEARAEGSRKKAVVPIVDVLFVEQIVGF